MKRPTIFFSLFILLIFFWLLPIWVFEFLPFVDLPQHLAIAHIVHNHHNPDTSIYSQFFTLKFFPKAHILHTLFLHWANYLMPLEIAAKLFVSLIIILLPISIYLFIKAQGGNPWFSLFSFFFIYNYNLMWGFIAFCLGISFFFFNLSLLIQHREIEQQKQKLKVDIMLSLLLVLAVFLHAYIYLLLLLSFLIFELFAKYKAKEIARQLVVLSPSLILFFFCTFPFWLEKKGFILKGISIFPLSLTSIWKRCRGLPGHIFSGLPFDRLVFWFILVVFLGLFCLWLGQVIRDKKYRWGKKEQMVWFLTTVIILLYLCLPLHLESVSIIAPRVAIFIPLLLLAPLSKIRIRHLTSLLVVSLVFQAMLWSCLMSSFNKFNAQAKPVRTLLEKIEQKKRLVELYTYPGDSGFFFHLFLHFGCYYIIWKDGLSGFIFPQGYRHHIVEMKEEASLPRINVFNAWKSIFPQGWEKFDYFLVCGKPSSENELWLKKTDRLRLLGQEGTWRLYTKEK